MTAKRQRKEKDAIDLILDELDFHGMTKDELTGKDGLLRQLTSRFYERILNAEMDEHLGYKKHDNAGDHSGNPTHRPSLMKMSSSGLASPMHG